MCLAVLRARKRFGQNFLVDPGMIQKIIGSFNIRPGDHIVEIGPGRGALTQPLYDDRCDLTLIEIDRDLGAELSVRFPDAGLINEDVMMIDFNRFAKQSLIRIIGNLPYNISTPLLFKLLDYGPLIADMHFMLQLEVVERLAAEPGNKSWGRLGVMAQFQCEVEQLFEVPPEAFFPPPKVQSAIIRLTPRQTPRWAQVDREALAKVVSQAFSQRRKTLRNNFKNSLTDTQFEAAGIDPQARAETLTIDHFVALASLSRS